MNARYCTHCGAPLHPNARFCGQCGGAVQTAPVAPAAAPLPVQAVPAALAAPGARAAPAAPTAAATEPILGIVPVLQRRKGFLGMGTETFNLILTPVRLIFVPVTSQEMGQAVNVAREQAKGQGKGWLGQVAAQMAWVDVVCQQYRSMPIDAVLAQHPGNFFILNGQVSRIRFRESTDEETAQTQCEIVVESVGGKHRFDLKGSSSADARQMLRQVLPHAVR